MKRKLSLSGPLVAVLAVVHAVFVWMHRDLRPVLTVLTSPPDMLTSKALAAGDSQFLYRVWGLDLQNAGDTGGRATPMRNYNYDFVLGWLTALQGLDPRGQQHAYLAANYYSLTPNLADVRRVLDFVADDAVLNPEQKWVWLLRAAEISELRLKDASYSLALAEKAAAYDLPAMSYSIVSLPAVFLEKLHRYDEARSVIATALEKRSSTMTPEESAWTRDFLQRLPGG